CSRSRSRTRSATGGRGRTTPGAARAVRWSRPQLSPACLHVPVQRDLCSSDSHERADCSPRSGPNHHPRGCDWVKARFRCGLAANLAHGATGADEARLVDPMLELLVADGEADRLDDLLVRRAVAQPALQIPFAAGEEAGSELAVRGDADPVAR